WNFILRLAMTEFYCFATAEHPSYGDAKFYYVVIKFILRPSRGDIEFFSCPSYGGTEFYLTSVRGNAEFYLASEWRNICPAATRSV
uniref:hypothetical protein n=1 Tax=uncultured Campylobacter sp. TaxID=218934 RepID=UPI002629F43C